MNESLNGDDGGFEELLNGLSEQFEQQLFERRIMRSILAARGAGVVYVEAITNGVPHDLAQAMAAEVWTAEGGPDAEPVDNED
ncbi:hypothetical protein ACFV1L_06230 [Kitasatospora sp. NPDC059646]|uniref:hypothetical protein n=1 Tax=Kitasatospora sp. NPDC059646 TaxID=3346893 RepID=UPI0036BAC986